MEFLERRLLLASANAAIEHAFRSDTFTLAGTFSYRYSEPGYVDQIPSGNFNITNGDVTWSSTADGQGSVAGVATGSGSDTIQGNPCSSYSIRDTGSLTFDVDAATMDLEVKSVGNASTTYPTYVDHTGGSCPPPDPPVSVFFGGVSNKYVGSFDPADSSFSLEYRDTGVSVTAPAAQVQWTNSGNSDFVVNAPTTALGPDDPLVFTVDVNGKPNPVLNSNPDEFVAAIELFWLGKNTNPVRREAITLSAASNRLGLYWNSDQAKVTVNQLRDMAPDWADHVEVHVVAKDGISDDDPQNSIAEIPLSTDHVANSLSYVPGNSIAEDKLEFSFTIGSDIPASEDVYLNLYWSRDEVTDRGTYSSLISPAFRSNTSVALTTAQKKAGTHVFSVLVEGLSSRPSNANFIVGHIDSGGAAKFDGDLAEGNENDNFANLDALPDIVLNDDELKWFPEQGIDIGYEIKNRAFVPDLTPVDVHLFWSDSASAVGGTPAAPVRSASIDRTVIPVDGNFFAPPLLSSKYLIVRFDLDDEIDEIAGNELNVAKVPLPIITPTVTFRPDVATRKVPYDAQFEITTDAPFNVDVALAWQEIPESDEVRDAYTCTNSADASTCQVAGEQVTTTVTVPAGRSEFSSKRLSRTWNWIEPLSTNAATTGDLLKQVGAVLGSKITSTAIDSRVKELLDPIGKEDPFGVGTILTKLGEELVAQIKNDIAEPPKETPAVNIGYVSSVTVNVADGAYGRNDEFQLDISVDEGNAKHLANAQALAGMATQYMNLFQDSVTGIGKGIVNVATKVAEIQLLMESWDDFAEAIVQSVSQYQLAVDPPDPSFDQLAQPPTLPFAAGDSIHDRLAIARSNLASLDDAVSTTVDRLLGAQLAGEQDHVASQLVHRSSLEDQRARVYMQLINSEEINVAFNTLIRDAASTNGVVSSQTVIAYLSERGIPQEQLQVLEAALEIGLGDANQSIPDAGLNYARFQAALAAGEAINRLLEGIEHRVHTLGASVTAVEQPTLEEIESLEAEIQEVLAREIPGITYQEKIYQLIDLVREGLIETNNAQTLGSHLSFAYGALAQYQQLSVKPLMVGTKLEAFLQAENIPASEIDAVNEILGAASQLVSVGEIDAALRELAKLRSIAGSLSSEDASEALTGYSQLLQASNDLLQIREVRTHPTDQTNSLPSMLEIVFSGDTNLNSLIANQSIHQVITVSSNSGTFPLTSDNFSWDESNRTLKLLLTEDGTNGGGQSLLRDESYLLRLDVSEIKSAGGQLLQDTDGRLDGMFEIQFYPDFSVDEIKVVSGVEIVGAHFVAGGQEKSTVMFRALSSTTADFEVFGVSPSGLELKLLNEQLDEVGELQDGRLVAALEADQEYALLIDRNANNQVVYVGSLAGVESLVQAGTNLLLRFDVNASGTVSAADALLVINYLARNPSGAIPARGERNRFYDVNSSDSITALDALQVINRLAVQRNSTAESESTTNWQPAIGRATRIGRIAAMHEESILRQAPTLRSTGAFGRSLLDPAAALQIDRELVAFDRNDLVLDPSTWEDASGSAQADSASIQGYSRTVDAAIEGLTIESTYDGNMLDSNIETG